MSGQIEDTARRCWKSSDSNDLMQCYLAMQGRVTLSELIEHFAENYPHVDPMRLNLNYVTATWEEPPTADDLAKREAWRVQKAQRQERWERATYERLKAKFDVDNKPQVAP